AKNSLLWPYARIQAGGTESTVAGSYPGTGGVRLMAIYLLRWRRLDARCEISNFTFPVTKRLESARGLLSPRGRHAARRLQAGPTFIRSKHILKGFVYTTYKCAFRGPFSLYHLVTYPD